MSDELVPVDVVGVGKDLFGSDLVVLRDQHDRSLPIWIMPAQAESIRQRLEGQDTPRPFTHDLLLNLVRLLNAEVVRLMIDDLWHSTFYAKLVLSVGEDEEMEIDCRPSDGIAIALRAEAPIYVLDEVLEEGKFSEEAAEDPGEDIGEEDPDEFAEEGDENDEEGYR